MEIKKVRLQKLISECGVASRRKAEELILQGRVKVNGVTASIGDSVVPGKDKVTVNGTPVRQTKDKIYIALNKPRGYVTTLNDELGRKCVTELIDLNARIYPVGRLDKDSEGLLILTNDGEFANGLTHPRYHVPKVYKASLSPAVTEKQLAAIEAGILLDGKMTAPAKTKVIKQEFERSVVEITLFEGRNRQIRRMCEVLNLEVKRLSRVAIGIVKLGGLPVGEYRMLEQNEVNSLKKAAGITGAAVPKFQRR